MNETTKKLAEALEDFIKQAESSGQHDDTLEYAKKVLKEYRKAVEDETN